MTILTFSVLLFVCSLFAGLLGALMGLGGGVIIIPALVLLFHIPIHYAMGASLVSVLATSSGTASAYLRQGYTNLRIGLFLETAAIVGALLGALLVTALSKTLLTILFSLLLFLSAYMTVKRREQQEPFQNSHPWAVALKLDGTCPHETYVNSPETMNYRVQNVPLAWAVMGLAGTISGLLGIGSGILNVLALDQALKLPYKVATTTSTFMIGMTAAASIGIYFSHGLIDPVIVFPVMLGVVMGAFSGAKILYKIKTPHLRIIFSILLCLIGIEMLYQAFTGAR